MLQFNFPEGKVQEMTSPSKFQSMIEITFLVGLE